MADRLSGAELERRFGAVLGAFDQAELERLFRTKLETDLTHVAAPGGLERVVWQAVDWVCRQGRLRDFLAAVGAARPMNQSVRDVVAPLLAHPAGRESLPDATRWHYLHRYARTGHVPGELITLRLADAYGSVIPLVERQAFVDAANAERRSADPDCGPGCFVTHEEAPNEKANHREYWYGAPTGQAKSPGPWRGTSPHRQHVAVQARCSEGPERVTGVLAEPAP